MSKLYSRLATAGLFFFLATANAPAQPLDLSRLPKNYHLSADDTRLVRGRVDNAKLYDLAEIKVIEFLFAEENWFARVDDDGLLGSVVYGGDTLREVYIQVKGHSSDFLNETRKKSFNVKVDSVREDQNLAGYTSLNLHTGFNDDSHVREVLFYDLARRHLPASQSNYVELRINGKSWGTYMNTQQIDGKFIDQYFFGERGPRWRGESPFGRIAGADTCTGRTHPGSPPSGSGMLYLGPDSADYANYYVARGKQQAGDWDKLVRFITKLNLTPAAELADTLPNYLNIDEAMWFLAHEILFIDSDSYIFKTQSDYQLYFDPSTGQMIPLEYDGNGSFLEGHHLLSPTFRSEENCMPLIRRLLSVPRWRQRYLAHFRDLVEEQYDTVRMDGLVDRFAGMIDALERTDSVGAELTTYEEFRASLPLLKPNFKQRADYLAGLAELRASNILIDDVRHGATDGRPGPILGDGEYFVTARVTGPNVGEVYVHVAPDPRVLPKGVSARFRENRMYDDGLHGDGAAGDNVFGARLTAQTAGALHRYYFEATGATEVDPSEFLPTGAEHETFYFESASAVASQLGPVRINELVADNETGATDEEGKFEDWIELYNDSDSRVDLGGFAISDDPARPQRYVFPDGVAIEARGYLIVWADDDQDDGPLHTNFNLSKSGEALSLVNRNGTIVDTVKFPELAADQAYARQPDGTGAWKITTPTYGVTNGGSVATREARAYAEAKLYPNPSAGDVTTLELPRTGLEVSIHDQLGRRVWQEINTSTQVEVSTAGMPIGMYVVSVRGEEGVRHLTLVRQ